MLKQKQKSASEPRLEPGLEVPQRGLGLSRRERPRAGAAGGDAGHDAAVRQTDRPEAFVPCRFRGREGDDTRRTPRRDGGAEALHGRALRPQSSDGPQTDRLAGPQSAASAFQAFLAVRGESSSPARAISLM